ncbi:MAG: hypothetical protein ACD_2C00182G0011 [uncultured bacterium (gcode 4)]|uniref:Uncharacterized protein n=1 Tax=uncultured bacterium (gcode 4) TaxID=1234023 RepID=K2FE13_9BACT|nr:MAG: hypothetical protein ACD_2C00182G0011 [uncultured bacterium (gcode 4)]
MRNQLRLILSLILIFWSVNLTFAALPCSKPENLKDKEYSNYCKSIENSCNNYFDPSKIGENLLKVKQIPFSPIPMTAEALTASTSQEDYDAFLDELESNVNYIWVKPLEQARTVYVETQNAFYNCAILWTKLKVMKTIDEEIKTEDVSNIKTKITAQIKSLAKEVGNRNCNLPAVTPTSYKKMLLDWVTYNYCNYRFYLNYLGNFPELNLNAPTITSKVTRSAIDKEETADYAKRITRQSDAVYKEVVHAKQVYTQAFSAFSEMENTYWIHVMLLFINDDYISLRKNLSSVLAPISQLAYKIPQAQCKSNCK